MNTVSAYSPPKFRGRIDLDLSRNEGRQPLAGFEGGFALVASETSRYPQIDDVRVEFARRFQLAPERVLVTAGGDDALLRICLATLAEGKEALIASPTFEMIPRYAKIAGGTVREVSWPAGAFPRDAFLEAANERTAVAFVVSPNNPTGAVASAEDLRVVARTLSNCLVVLDAAYGEFAEEDLTPVALEFDNVVIVRTLSKAWGLAGLRVGCALGSASWIQRLAASGNPFPVSAVSARIALTRLASGEAEVLDYLERARFECDDLCSRLQRLGARPAEPSSANFVLARGLDPAWTAAALGSLGIAIRAFPNSRDLSDAVRITVPGSEAAYERLTAALEAALAPEAILFDLDGVLADVSTSYRSTILATARQFGVELESADIERAKSQGNANDDWALTWSLITERGVEASLEEVTEAFEVIYQGTATAPGLCQNESLLVDRERLAAWRKRFKIAIVTGRPRSDALAFLERFDQLESFDAVICREDATLKPSPEPVELALRTLSVRRAWMLGDTRDDLEAARGAGVIPLGVVAPGADQDSTISNLERAGAARVLTKTTELEDLLP